MRAEGPDSFDTWAGLGEVPDMCGEEIMSKRCVITCMEPGCKNPIYYYTDDIEVPLYCERHRTDDGRHSAVRNLLKPIPPKQPDKYVILRCPVCKTRKQVLHSDWLLNKPYRCICGGNMLYHKDVD